MSEKKPSKHLKKPIRELTDDELARSLFPKKVIDRVNEAIGHKPVPQSHTEKDTK
jgi:hypothetical protein